MSNHKNSQLQSQWTVHQHQCVDSTMDVAREHIIQFNQTKNSQPFVIITETQTNGRGRFDRQWSSPIGNFYATYCFQYTTPPATIGLYSLVTAVAAVDALCNLNIESFVKWPNDLYIDHKKFGGILIESVAPNWLMIGIGVNLAMSPSTAVLKPTTSILESHHILIRPAEFHHQFGHSLSQKITLFSQLGWKSLKNQWQNSCVHTNQVVTINYINHGSKTQITGLCLGINDAGALIMQDLSTKMITEIYTGDVL